MRSACSVPWVKTPRPRGRLRPLLLLLLLLLGAGLALGLTGCGARNAPPSVRFESPSPTNPETAAKVVRFVAVGEDPDLPSGETLRFRWDFGDGTTRETSRGEVEHRYARPGRYTVTVIAVDPRGAESPPASLTITVRNAPPRAEIAAEPREGTAPLRVAFDASGSQDPDGSIARYEWTFGDGTTARGERVEHLYEAAGVFTATLTVTDEDGAQATASVTIRVEAPKPPVSRLWEVRLVVTPEGRYLFDPELLFVRPGDRVRWVCARGCPHTATAYALDEEILWDSGPLAEGERYEWTVPSDLPEGSYPYRCRLHETLGMVGLVVVGRPGPLDPEWLNALPSNARLKLLRLGEEAAEEFPID